MLRSSHHDTMLFVHSSATVGTQSNQLIHSIPRKTLRHQLNGTFAGKGGSSASRQKRVGLSLKAMGKNDSSPQTSKTSSKILHGEHQGKLKSFFYVFPEHHVQMESPEFFSLMKQPPLSATNAKESRNLPAPQVPSELQLKTERNYNIGSGQKVEQGVARNQTKNE